MVTVTVSGPVVVTDDATDRPITDPERLRTFDGLSSGRETCAKYLSGELAELGLEGGAVTLAFDPDAGTLHVVSAYTAPRELTADELRALVAHTAGQWSDGIGEGCFDAVMDERQVFIELTPYGTEPAATQADDGKPPPRPKKSPAAELVKAAGAGDLAKVKELAEAGAKLDGRGTDGRTPLTAAIAGDRREVALFLIGRGADPNAAAEDGQTPLGWAAIRSQTTRDRNVRLAEALLDAGAAVDGPDRNGYTPLIWAANRGSLPLVELLLARGADVNARTTEKYNAGRTALMLADGIAAVRVLLAAGADPKAVDENGTPAADHHTGAAKKLIREKAGQT